MFEDTGHVRMKETLRGEVLKCYLPFCMNSVVLYLKMFLTYSLNGVGATG